LAVSHASKSGATGAFSSSNGVLIAPLGYSLIGLGAAWVLGTWVTPSEDAPWIALAAGLGVFAASYGLSAALNPRTSPMR
jgi:hypothetical protein